MKTLLVLVCICLVGALGALTDEQKAKLKAYKTSCIQETGVAEDDVEKAKTGQIPEDNEKLSCFAACMLKKIGIMNPDGTVNEEVARSKIPQDVPQEKAEEVFKKCKDVSGSNTCEKGGNLMKCFMENKDFSVLH